MTCRSITFADRIFGEIDKVIKVLAAPARAQRPTPRAPGGELVLQEADRRRSARLMRVNHSGEVAAQALYQGQALTARNDYVRDSLNQAAREEMDHLAWCDQRLHELRGRPSRLNGVWYAGSYGIGVLAGAFGDRASLGFIVETEAQVESHLRGHLDRLPAADQQSRVIVRQMISDEANHGAKAAGLGAHGLPLGVVSAMKMVSRAMTVGAYWL